MLGAVPRVKENKVEINEVTFRMIQKIGAHKRGRTGAFMVS